MQRILSKALFYLVALVLVAWTSSLTMSFVGAVLPLSPWYVRILALVVFDVGMLAWLMVFIHLAEGSVQRGAALALCALDMIGVGLVSLAEILTGGQTFAAAPALLGEAATWGIGIWTFINVAAVVLFHLGDPEARKAIAIQDELDGVFDAAMGQLKAAREANAAVLGQRLYTDMQHRLEAQVTAMMASTDKSSDGGRAAAPPEVTMGAPAATAGNGGSSWRPGDPLFDINAPGYVEFKEVPPFRPGRRDNGATGQQ